MSGRIIMQATCVYVSYAGYSYMSDVSIISLTSLIVSCIYYSSATWRLSQRLNALQFQKLSDSIPLMNCNEFQLENRMSVTVLTFDPKINLYYSLYTHVSGV